MIVKITPALQILDLNIVTSRLIVPICSNDLMASFHIIVETVFPSETVEVIEDFATACVDRRPIKFRLEGPSIVVRWYIAGASIGGRVVN
jgi:hypothetical protein